MYVYFTNVLSGFSQSSYQNLSSYAPTHVIIKDYLSRCRGKIPTILFFLAVKPLRPVALNLLVSRSSTTWEVEWYDEILCK